MHEKCSAMMSIDGYRDGSKVRSIKTTNSEEDNKEITSERLLSDTEILFEDPEKYLSKSLGVESLYSKLALFVTSSPWTEWNKAMIATTSIFSY